MTGISEADWEQTALDTLAEPLGRTTRATRLLRQTTVSTLCYAESNTTGSARKGPGPVITLPTERRW